MFRVIGKIFAEHRPDQPPVTISAIISRVQMENISTKSLDWHSSVVKALDFLESAGRLQKFEGSGYICVSSTLTPANKLAEIPIIEHKPKNQSKLAPKRTHSCLDISLSTTTTSPINGLMAEIASIQGDIAQVALDLVLPDFNFTHFNLVSSRMQRSLGYDSRTWNRKSNKFVSSSWNLTTRHSALIRCVTQFR